MTSTVIRSNVADDRLIAAMRENSHAGVCELAELLGLSCPDVSRRIARLKALGVVDYVDDAGWSRSRSRRRMRPEIRPIHCYDRVSEQAARTDEEDREEGKHLYRLRRPVLDTRLPRYR